jgi:hypothetical protein
MLKTARSLEICYCGHLAGRSLPEVRFIIRDAEQASLSERVQVLLPTRQHHLVGHRGKAIMLSLSPWDCWEGAHQPRESPQGVIAAADAARGEVPVPALGA